MARALLSTPPWPATSFWNRRLPANATLHSNSAAVVADLVAQVGATPTATTYINEGTGPVYVVDASTPTYAVTFPGGTDSTLVAAFAQTPIPTGAQVGPDTDQHVTFYKPSTGELWELWKADIAAKSASYGGYIADCRSSTGRFESPHPAWGASATSLPLIGGSVLIGESLAKVIPHALSCAIPSIKTGAVWPAQRTDGAGLTSNANDPQEGMCFRLPASYNPSGLTNPWTRAVATAIRDFGMYLRDKSSTIAPYAEDWRDNTGVTDPIAPLYGGEQRWQAMASFPWSSLQVVDPTYLQALAASPLAQVGRPRGLRTRRQLARR